MNVVNVYLAKTLFGMSIKHILIAIAIFFVIVFLRNILSKVLIRFLKYLASKTKNQIDDKLIDVLEAPFRFSFIILGFYLAQRYLDLKSYGIFFDKIISTLAVFVIFWIIYRLVDEFNSLVLVFSSKLGNPLHKDIENFIIKTCRVLVIIFCFLMILQTWGVNITAFIASLGLGGLAFALAAKDTTANLFGSLVIFTDRPFKLDDYVEINGVEGIVEDIGIRSTRIRTPSRSLVAIPNAVVANASIANYTKRTRRRANFNIALTYETSSEKIEKIVNDIKQMISTRKDIHEDTINVGFESFGESSLNIICQYHTKTTNGEEFLKIRQEINIAIMSIVEKNGSNFAYPTQTLHAQKESRG